jgi:hypothetical protein
MKLLNSLIGAGLLAGSIAHGQVACSDYGQAIYCSNGLSAVRAANTFYFSDGTTAQSFGNTITISGQPVEVSRSDAAAANYALGQAIGTVVGGVIAEVRQRRKFYRVCDVNPYARGWLNGSPAFCSEAAIVDACSNVPQFDFSGFKYAGDRPRHLSWTGTPPAATLFYLPNTPKFDGEIECAPDVATHSTHLAKLWLVRKHEAEYYLHDSHPRLSQDDCARIVNYIYTHPEAYNASKVTVQMFENIYVAVRRLRKSQQ